LKIKHANHRTIIQIFSALILNMNIKGFFTGTLYTGSLKTVCVPVLNCYSCPGALGSCPIGALQSVANTRKLNVSFYTVGILALIGISVGRLFCGWTCPFGWFQDLIYKIPIKKRPVIGKIGRVLSYGKYLVLLVFVFILPAAVYNTLGLGEPAFCKWICPAGTLEASFPLLLTNPSLRELPGLLYSWKIVVLMAIITLSLFTSRPFCRFLCPLGAFYALFQRFSLLHLTVNKSTCTSCKKCQNICKLDIQPQINPNHPDCIRCLDCIQVCPTGALTVGFKQKPGVIDTRSVPDKDLV